jgi:hypothetical protein
VMVLVVCAAAEPASQTQARIVEMSALISKVPGSTFHVPRFTSRLGV